MFDDDAPHSRGSDGRYKICKQNHWDSVYRTRPADQVSWYQITPEPSLGVIRQLDLPASAAMIDVGGGASVLIDFLMQENPEWSLRVLDISAKALDLSRARLGNDAARIEWIVEDVTHWRPERPLDLWHDRAVFHFFTDPADRQAYVAAMRETLRPGGWAVIATFSPNGPTQCSNLQVQRYDTATLMAEIGKEFQLQDHFVTTHRTPSGKEQEFQFVVAQRI